MYTNARSARYGILDGWVYTARCVSTEGEATGTRRAPTQIGLISIGSTSLTQRLTSALTLTMSAVHCSVQFNSEMWCSCALPDRRERA